MPLFSLSVSQLLLAFVAASILHKLTFNRLFLKWLTSHKFVCYLAPSDNELRRLKDKANNNGHEKKSKARNRSKKNHSSVFSHERTVPEIFKIPAVDLDSLVLEKTLIECRDLELIKFSVDLEWIVDLAIMSVFSYVITEAQFYFCPTTNECNFSLLWAVLVLMYCNRSLWKLTATYFKDEQSIGERSICIISGCVFMLVAMIILIVDEKHLELGLEDAYISFNRSATAFIRNNRMSSATKHETRPVTLLIVKILIAIFSALTGVMFTFPGLRFGQLHTSLMEKPETTGLQRFAYIVNYLGPLFIICLWVRPISRDLLKSFDVAISDETYNIFRIYCVLFLCLVRFQLLPKYLATFLLSTPNRITRLRQRGGMTSNREIQLTVSSINYYINAVTIQYILPMLMCFFTAIMFKTMGGHSWIPEMSGSWETQAHLNATGAVDAKIDQLTVNDIKIANDSVPDKSTNFAKLVSSAAIVDLNDVKRVFSADVFRGVLGFATWWLHFSWFCTSSMGVIYHTYLTQ